MKYERLYKKHENGTKLWRDYANNRDVNKCCSKQNNEQGSSIRERGYR